MNKNTIILLLALMIWTGIGATGCSSSRNTAKITVVKPKKRIFAYNPRKDRHRKRTKRVTYRLH